MGKLDSFLNSSTGDLSHKPLQICKLWTHFCHKIGHCRNIQPNLGAKYSMESCSVHTDAVGCVFRCEFAGKIYLLLFFQIFHSTIASILPLNRFDYKSLNFFFQNRSKSGEVLSKHRRTISLRKRQVTQTNHLMRFLYLDLHFFCWP